MIVDLSRLITAFGYLILLDISIMVVMVARKKLDYIGWIFLSLHGIVFYVVIAFDGQDQLYNLGMFGIYGAAFYNLWSTALRDHSLVVGILTLSVLYKDYRALQKRGKAANGS